MASVRRSPSRSSRRRRRRRRYIRSLDTHPLACTYRRRPKEATYRRATQLRVASPWNRWSEDKDGAGTHARTQTRAPHISGDKGCAHSSHNTGLRQLSAQALHAHRRELRVFFPLRAEVGVLSPASSTPRVWARGRARGASRAWSRGSPSAPSHRRGERVVALHLPAACPVAHEHVARRELVGNVVGRAAAARLLCPHAPEQVAQPAHNAPAAKSRVADIQRRARRFRHKTSGTRLSAMRAWS